MSKRRQPAAPPRTKAEALARVARLERQLRTLQRQLERSMRRADEAVRESAEGQRALAGTLEQQAATAEILGVMSGSPADVQPVLDVITRHAVRLCQGYFAAVFLSDGELIHARAMHNFPPDWLKELGTSYPAPLASDLRTARVVRECRVIHVLDMQDGPEVSEETRRARVGGYRTWIGVPLLGASGGVGAIAVARREGQAFAETEIELLRTFAAQAVIALENARLFHEIQQRNAALREALDRQTATADVLRIIAASPTELQPVLDAIAASAVRLCEASDAVIERLEGDRFYNAAHAGALMKGLVGLPLPLTRQFPGGRAVLDRQRVNHRRRPARCGDRVPRFARAAQSQHRP
jgi:GAF domain-containing protein